MSRQFAFRFSNGPGKNTLQIQYRYKYNTNGMFQKMIMIWDIFRRFTVKGTFFDRTDVALSYTAVHCSALDLPPHPPSYTSKCDFCPFIPCPHLVADLTESQGSFWRFFPFHLLSLHSVGGSAELWTRVSLRLASLFCNMCAYFVMESIQSDHGSRRE